MDRDMLENIFSAYCITGIGLACVSMITQNPIFAWITAAMLVAFLLVFPIVAVAALGSPFNACKQWEEYR